MKAAVHTRYGPPDVVRVVDVPMPTPTDNEVLVKVHATTVNRTDCGFRGAKPFFVRVLTGLVRPRVKILGNEFAGQVEALGPGATSFAVGDRVFGYDDTVCGAHAQYLTIREDASLARIPGNLTYAQAAPATEGSHYASRTSRRRRFAPGSAYSSTARPGPLALRPCNCWRVAACTSPRSATPRISSSRAAWGPNGLSTAPLPTSPRMRRPMTWCSTRWERVRSASVGDCWNRAGCTCQPTWARPPRTHSWR